MRSMVFALALLLPIHVQAAITFVATGATSSSTGSNNRPLVIPAIINNDLLVAQVAIRGNRTITPPAGWTLIRRNVSGGTITQAIYYKLGLASDSGTSATWTFNASDDNAGVIRAYRGVDTAAPIGNSSGRAGNSATMIANSINTTLAGEWLLAFYGVADGRSSPASTPAGMSERYDFDNGGGNNGLALAGDDEAIATTGATGNRVSVSSLSDRYVAHLLALKPAPAVVAIDRAGADPTPAATVSWAVTFTKSVSGVGNGNFALVNVGLGGAPAIISVTGSGATRTVTASTGSGSGTLGLNMVNTTGVTPALTNLPFTGQVYTIDRTPPVVSSIARVDPSPTGLASVSWTVSFSKNVSGVDAGDFALAQAGGVSGALITAVTPVSAAVYTVTAGTGTGAGTLGLNLVDNDSIIDTASTPLGGAGAGNGNFTGEIYSVFTPLTATASPTACVNDASIGTRPWGTLTGPLASDNLYATASVNDNQTTNYLQCTGYGFAIPSGATIVGITVNVERSASNTLVQDAAMRMVKAGVIDSNAANDRSTATGYTTTDVIEAHGGGADTWGTVWTAADINDPNFGAAFASVKAGTAGGARTVRVDHMPITVTYTLPGNLILSIDRADPDPTAAASVSWTVTFSGSVSGVSSANFTLVNSGLGGAPAITGVSGGPSVWTVTASTGTGTGTLGLNMTNTTGVSPGISGLPFIGQIYSVRPPAPVTYYHDTTNGVDIGFDGPTNVVSNSNVNIPPIITASLTLANTCTGSARSRNHPAGAFTHSRWYFNTDYAVDTDIGANPSGSAYLLARRNTDTVVVSLYDYDPVSGAKALIGSSPVITLTGANALTAYPYTISSPLYTVQAGHRLMLEYSFTQIATNDNARVYCSAANSYITVTEVAVSPLAQYRMDQANWNGTAGEVLDSSGNGNHAQAFNGASTDGVTPAIAGNPGTCRYGVFDNGGVINKGYVLTPLPNFTTDFTIAAWIRTTNNSIGGQRILIDDQSNSGGYGFSLGDGGAGRLRLYARSIAPVILDSTYTIANNTWYFAAAVIDIGNRKRSIYVFDAAGTLLGSNSDAAPFTGTWGTDAGPVSIGGETNASGESPAGFHFRGNLDEVRVYGAALSQAALAGIAQRTHACTVVAPVPDHYELSMATNSLACLPTTVTVTACTDATSPCTNPFAAASGTTAVLASSGGTLAATPVTFGATGVASTTLSYPAAPNGTPAVVTLSAEQTAASNPRKWCPDGAGCVVANSGTTTFNTAGFIFSTAAGGGVASIPTQVAGISSATNYLRAVKTSTTTQACEAALAGPNAVEFAYECNNPTSCYTSDLMSVNGGASTTVARNNNGSVATYLPVNMTFDANGNAPFTFNYADVGQVKLWARKAAGGSLLSALAGSTNSFVVKPHHFDITNIACSVVGAGTCAPANGTGVNPAAVGPAGAAFIQAGQLFKATVTAMNGAATPAFTPNFGKETSAEGAELTSFNHLPGLGGASAINRVLGGFNSGASTLSDLAWNEVGVLQLKATLSNANGYLGSDVVNGKNSVVSTVNPYVGRFIPDHFDTVVTAQGGGFAYSGNPAGPVPGQPFTVAATAKNSGGTSTANYTNAGGYAKDINLSVPVGGATGQLYVDAVAGGTGAIPAAKFLNLVPGEGKVNYTDATGKISFVFNSLPYAEQAIQIHAEDADTVTSSGANGAINIRHGRLRIFNAFGGEKADLSLPLRAEYWTGNSWTINSADSFSVVPAASVALSGYTGTLSAANLGASHVTGATLVAGQGSIVLTKPSPVATGSVDLAINLGAGAADLSCLAAHPASTGAAIPWLRSIYGSCAVTYDRDPSARGSFGIYAPETRKTIHVRELY